MAGRRERAPWKDPKVESAAVLLAAVEDSNLKVQKDFQTVVVQSSEGLKGYRLQVLIDQRFAYLVMHREK